MPSGRNAFRQGPLLFLCSQGSSAFLGIGRSNRSGRGMHFLCCRWIQGSRGMVLDTVTLLRHSSWGLCGARGCPRARACVLLLPVASLSFRELLSRPLARMVPDRALAFFCALLTGVTHDFFPASPSLLLCAAASITQAHLSSSAALSGASTVLSHSARSRGASRGTRQRGRGQGLVVRADAVSGPLLTQGEGGDRRKGQDVAVGAGCAL